MAEAGVRLYSRNLWKCQKQYCLEEHKENFSYTVNWKQMRAYRRHCARQISNIKNKKHECSCCLAGEDLTHWFGSPSIKFHRKVSILICVRPRVPSWVISSMLATQSSSQMARTTSVTFTGPQGSLGNPRKIYIFHMFFECVGIFSGFFVQY